MILVVIASILAALELGLFAWWGWTRHKALGRATVGRRMLGEPDCCPTHGPYQTESGICPTCWTVIERWTRGKTRALRAAYAKRRRR